MTNNQPLTDEQIKNLRIEIDRRFTEDRLALQIAYNRKMDDRQKAYQLEVAAWQHKYQAAPDVDDAKRGDE